MEEITEEKLNLSELKKLDPWILIETYFRDNPNFKTQHQIDSFNELVLYFSSLSLSLIYLIIWL